jgi:heptaprenyl diphosphate synthase
VPWGSRFAVLLADYLLARAYELAAQGGAAVVTEFADALTASCEGRARELRAEHGGGAGLWEATAVAGTDRAVSVDLLTARMATVFELPCRLGGRLGGASPAVVDALAGYGRHLGVSYALADELRAARGERTGAVLDPLTGHRPLPDAAPEELARLVDEHARRARAALGRVPDGPARDLLHRLAQGPDPATGGSPG